MPVCTSGISQARPGVATSVIVDSAYVKSILPSTLAWLYDYLPFMHGLEIGDVGAFCSVDPPTWSIPSTQDFFNFATGGPYASYQLVNQFLQDVTRAYIWYSLCQCSVGSPTALTAPTEPADMPAVNPYPIVGPSTALACREAENTFAYTSAMSNVDVYAITVNLADLHVTRIEVTTTEVQHGFTLSRRFDMRYSYVPGIALPPAIFTGWNAFSPGTGLSGTVVLTPPTDPPVFTMEGTAAIAPGFPIDMIISVRFFCGGQVPGVAPTPCCPPDQISTGLLYQILNLVTLQQRQSNPFAYIAGSSHAGLTGSGTIAVQGILGALLNVSGLSHYGRDDGEPETYYRIGDLRFGTNDGYSMRIPIDTDSQVIFPESSGVYTVIAYNLEPGVTMTLTELLREF